MVASSAPIVGLARSSELPDEECARADCYRLLGGLLSKPPTPDMLIALQKAPKGDTGLAIVISDLADLARTTPLKDIEREYHTLFVGMPRGELLPYASYYLTGFLHEKPLAKVRADLQRLGLQRANGVPEPEDHIGHLCEVMSLLIDGGPYARDIATQQNFFGAHLRRWAAKFFTDLEKAQTAQFYRPVGRIGREFMTIEQAAFALAA